MATPARSLPRQQEASPRRVDRDGVSASSLSLDDKRSVWRYIKANDPGLQQALCDPLVRSLMDTFDATPVFDPDLVRKALQQ